LPLLLLAGFPFLAAPSASAEPVEAVSLPSADVTLSFVQAGRVVEVLVKEGDVVEAGQVLARQDDAAERLQLAQLKAQAKDTTRIDAGEAQLAQKREDLKKLQWARDEGAATEWEVAHARLDVRIAELSVKLARFEHEQAGLKYEEMKVRVDRMRLVSPLAGRVEEVSIEAGESAEPLAPAIRIVKIDPLWIDAAVPLVRARELAPGRAARVSHANPGPSPGERPDEGKVVHVAAVADAASDTLTVRVEVPNPSGRPAGERVRVTFPPASASALSAAETASPAPAENLSRAKE
jgi:RND family efflux transporter MFP subunit